MSVYLLSPLLSESLLSYYQIIIIIPTLYSTFNIKYIRSKVLKKQIHVYIQTIYEKHQ